MNSIYIEATHLRSSALITHLTASLHMNKSRNLKARYSTIRKFPSRALTFLPMQISKRRTPQLIKAKIFVCMKILSPPPSKSFNVTNHMNGLAKCSALKTLWMPPWTMTAAIHVWDAMSFLLERMDSRDVYLLHLMEVQKTQIVFHVLIKFNRKDLKSRLRQNEPHIWIIQRRIKEI